MGRKPFSIKIALVGFGLLLVLLPCSWCVCCPETGTTFEWKYRYRVRNGMTLAEVEAVLGPGQQREGPPQTRDGPVIQGDEFYYWYGENGKEIYIGFRGGKVCDKWFWPANFL